MSRYADLRWLGVVVAVVTWFVLAPVVSSAWRTLNGYVWVPYTGPSVMARDMIIYGAHVQEAHEQFVRFENPIAQDFGGAYVDILKANTFRVLAALGFFLEDAQYAIVLSLLAVLVL